MAGVENTPAMTRPFAMLPTKRLLLAFAGAIGIVWFLLQGRNMESVRTRYQALSSSNNNNNNTDAHHDTKTTNILNEINNSTLGFEKIFVMGLPSRTDRRDGMVLQAALSDLAIEFVDGPTGDSIYEKAIITGESGKHMTGGGLGAWRGHINVLQEIVRRNISSALILEDDVDWDVRIRSLMRQVAVSSQALTQPLAVIGADKYADPTYPRNAEGAKAGPPLELDYERLPSVRQPRMSPYGDEWQTMWLGHCGMRFPTPESGLPLGRVLRRGDVTVPPSGLWTLTEPFELVDRYEPRTRAVHHGFDGLCSLGYAVTQRGARALLRESGLRDVTDAFDLTLRFFCDGTTGRRQHKCLAVQPPLFNHHRPAGNRSSNSEIGSHGSDYNTRAFTDMVQWPVRLNMDAIMDGETEFEDQFK